MSYIYAKKSPKIYKNNNNLWRCGSVIQRSSRIESADLSGLAVSIKSKNCTKGNITIPTVLYAFIKAKGGPIKHLFR